MLSWLRPMADPIFLDANIPMYAAGRPHPLKQPCLDVLALVALYPDAFCTDAEVFQEILHRYRAQGRWQDGQWLFMRFAALIQPRIETVTIADVERAAHLAVTYPSLDARDLLHLAVMDRVGSTRIVSADRAFDAVARVQRLDPMDVANWRQHVQPTGSV